MAIGAESGGYLARPQPSGLAEVVDLILDKGLVIDAYVRVSLVGIELLAIDARVVVASVDTYLRFAEAVNRLDLTAQATDLPELVGEATERTMEAGAKRKVKGTIERPINEVREKVEDARDKVEDFRDKVADKVDAAREKVT